MRQGICADYFEPRLLRRGFPIYCPSYCFVLANWQNELARKKKLSARPTEPACKRLRIPAARI